MSLATTRLLIDQDTLWRGAPLGEPIQNRQSGVPAFANDNQRLAYSVADAAASLGVGRTTIYKLHRDGKLPFVKIGRRTLIRADDLAAVFEREGQGA